MEICHATTQGTCPGSQGSSTYNPVDIRSTLLHGLPAVNRLSDAILIRAWRACQAAMGPPRVEETGCEDAFRKPA